MTGALGAVIGIGQALKASTPFTWRHAIGQALCAGGLGVSAGAVFIVFPDMDPRAYMGAATCFATLGANVLSSLVIKHTSK